MKNENLLRRLEIAEAAIEMLNSGKLPNVKKLLFGARCEVRRITDPTSFWSTPTEVEISGQLGASERVGIVKSLPHDPGKFQILFDRELNEEHQAFLARTLQSFMAVTYSAIGLDTLAAEAVKFESD